MKWDIYMARMVITLIGALLMVIGQFLPVSK